MLDDVDVIATRTYELGLDDKSTYFLAFSVIGYEIAVSLRDESGKNYACLNNADIGFNDLDAVIRELTSIVAFAKANYKSECLLRGTTHPAPQVETTENNEILDTLIAHAPLPTYVRIILERIPIRTVRDLQKWTWVELLQRRGFGVSAKGYVMRYLLDRGITLA